MLRQQPQRELRRLMVAEPERTCRLDQRDMYCGSHICIAKLPRRHHDTSRSVPGGSDMIPPGFVRRNDVGRPPCPVWFKHRDGSFDGRAGAAHRRPKLDQPIDLIAEANCLHTHLPEPVCGNVLLSHRNRHMERLVAHGHSLAFNRGDACQCGTPRSSRDTPPTPS